MNDLFRNTSRGLLDALQRQFELLRRRAARRNGGAHGSRT